MTPALLCSCEVCCGRGWVLTPCSQWPERCPACDGLGGWTARRLEKATGVDWRLYRSLAESRATKTTCVRILDALLVSQMNRNELRRAVEGQR